MKIKPHVHKGRFYNHEQDAILPRVILLFKSIVHAIGHQVKSYGRKDKKTKLQDFINNWVVTSGLHEKSQELIITWLGHATFLIQVGGINILTDPVFGEISSHTPRLVKMPYDFKSLPKIDLVIISHNHRDHVDEKSLKLLKSHQPHMFVPMGKYNWFAKRGFTKITQATWWDQLSFNNNNLELTFLPASHWTSRGLLDINKSLWGSWMLSIAGKNIYFAGDTAYSTHFLTIKKYFPIIDVALMPIGPNEPRHLMHDAHVSTQEAMQAFIDLDALNFIPMHWGTFVFGTDEYTGPIDLLKQVWEENSSRLSDKILHVVKFGEQRCF